MDDFLVRALFEKKSLSQKPRDSETRKFSPSVPLPNSVAMKVARRWRSISKLPVCQWAEGAKAVWLEDVMPSLEAGLERSSLTAEDEMCFVK